MNANTLKQIRELELENCMLLEALKRIKKFVDEDFPPKVAMGKRSEEYTSAWINMNEVIDKFTNKPIEL